MYTTPAYNSPGFNNKNPYGTLNNRTSTIPTSRMTTAIGANTRQQQQQSQPIQQQQQTTPTYTAPTNNLPNPSQFQAGAGMSAVTTQNPSEVYNNRLHDNGGSMDQQWADYDKKYTQPSQNQISDLFKSMGVYQSQKPTENDLFNYNNGDGSSVRMRTSEFINRQNDQRNQFLKDYQLNRPAYATPTASRPSFG